MLLPSLSLELTVPRLFCRFAWSGAIFLVLTALPCFTAAAPGSMTARTGDARASQHARGTWCQPRHVFVPKSGFRPGPAATNSQLLASGLPPRPLAASPAAVRLWRSVIRRARAFVPPNPICGTSRRTTIYSGNWAGHVVPKSDYGNGSYTASQAEWVQPAVAGDSRYRNYNHAPTVSLWTGIGVRHLMQAGADSIAAAVPTYKFWTEDYPQNMVWEGPAIRPGQVAYVYTENLGRNLAYYFLENVTTGDYSAFDNALPYIGTNAANFVVERPDGLYLPSFGSVSVWNSYFWQGNDAYELTPINDIWKMTSNCAPSGIALAEPSGVSGGAFTEAWQHRSPFTRYC